ncbi:hypothetical protein CEQ11_001865 [Micrococcus sp. FDAARGOS_333]|nr:hypothetical protein CEQ11_001865 [Micrococcus sp. FDAARGOS_333]
MIPLPFESGRKTESTPNSRKRHTPEQVVRKLGQADRMLTDAVDAQVGFPAQAQDARMHV